MNVAISTATESLADAGRADSATRRLAETAAIAVRVDKDRVIRAALDAFEADAHDSTMQSHAFYAYMFGASGISPDRFPDAHERGRYIRTLIAEIRLGLSPQARD